MTREEIDKLLLKRGVNRINDRIYNKWLEDSYCYKSEPPYINRNESYKGARSRIVPHPFVFGAGVGGYYKSTN